MVKTEMECKDVLKWLSDYIDGEIPPTLVAELEEHVQTCENCRIVLDTTRKTISLYHHHGEDQQVSEETRDHLYRTLNLEDYLPQHESHG